MRKPITILLILANIMWFLYQLNNLLVVGLAEVWPAYDAALFGLPLANTIALAFYLAARVRNQS